MVDENNVPGPQVVLDGLPIGSLSKLCGVIEVRTRRRHNMVWSALRDVRDRINNTPEDLLERHCLIVVIVDVHRVAAGVDRISWQRGRAVARGHLERPVADGE